MPRLATDGEGNLYIDEDGHPDNGKLVRYHEGSFITLNTNDPSHNDTHHQKFAAVDGTRDQEMVDRMAADSGLPEEALNREWLDSLVNVGNGENMHHYETQEDDPHYDGVKTLPDRLAASATGHTDAWKNVQTDNIESGGSVNG